MPIEKGAQIIEGKTKIIWAIKGKSGQNAVLVEHKNTITAHDDPSLTREFPSKAEHSTTTTCRVFELLKAAGIPVAYREQVSPTEFVADSCRMIPLEVIARRLAVGSYLKRFPHLTSLKGNNPHRFHRLIIEFFLKTTKGELFNADGEILVSDLDWSQEGGEEDPFIPNPFDPEWKLFHSKKPGWDPEANLDQTVNAQQALDRSDTKAFMEEMQDIMRRVFLVLEGAWNTLGLRLIDMKIEFGINHAGELVVSDVIDNDSWRLRTHDWQELSKQAFREGEKLDEVERKYGIVADLVKRFRIPQQALIFWTGSKSDELDASTTKLFQDALINGINFEQIVLSGHKKPRTALDKLEQIMAQYPDGGVIIVMVGRSNGLGPILAARTSWPVIAIPATLKDFPDDAWSSLRMPSEVPLLTAWPSNNAALAALNILANKNPVAYMIRQLAIENLDH
jgi:phosphoribosylaminoimidazole carboxylase / phosphoribosylaminoimidazole-succinocarboxamide synthase